VGLIPKQKKKKKKKKKRKNFAFFGVTIRKERANIIHITATDVKVYSVTPTVDSL
jgi:hypothetical protein